MSGASKSNSETRERSDRAELFLTGSRNLLTVAILTGNVQLASGDAASRVSTGEQTEGAQAQGAQQPAEAAAGRVTLHFAGQQILKTVHAEDGVRLSQKNSQSRTLVAAASPSQAKGGAQDLEMTAPVMDFIVKDGRLLKTAETSGPCLLYTSRCV